MVQIAYPRPVRFVMHRDYYKRWYLRWFLDFFGAVPIAPGQSKEALEQINILLKAGEMVCLSPEVVISRNGQLGEFKRGFERVVDGVDGIILPLYQRGFWGSRFPRSGEGLNETQSGAGRRDIIVAFGDPLPMNATTQQVKQSVFDLSIEAGELHTERLEPIPLAWMKTVKRQGGALCVADARGGGELSGYKTLVAAIVFSRSNRCTEYRQGGGSLSDYRDVCHLHFSQVVCPKPPGTSADAGVPPGSRGRSRKIEF